jgi:hypothetical protein
MAFCNACGAAMEANGKFCPSCGKPAAAGGAVVAAATPGKPAGGSALKIILIIVVALVGLGMIGAAFSAYIGYRIARASHVHQQGDKVRVETPFGTVETNRNPQELARRMGVDVYPGATPAGNGGLVSGVGGMKTIEANFDTDDPPTKVAEFYKARFPNATVSENGGGGYSIVSASERGMTTIAITSTGSKTHISIAVVGRGPSDPETR